MTGSYVEAVESAARSLSSHSAICRLQRSAQLDHEQARSHC